MDARIYKMILSIIKGLKILSLLMADKKAKMYLENHISDNDLKYLSVSFIK